MFPVVCVRVRERKLGTRVLRVRVPSSQAPTLLSKPAKTKFIKCSISSQRIYTRFVRFVVGWCLLHSLSGKTSGKASYRPNSWSLETARLDVIMVVSHWTLTGSSAALLPRCPSNFKRIKKVWTRISRLRDFTGSCGKTYVRLANKDPGQSHRIASVSL